jgi:HD-GYP domain-containing protein (c-di-GMP phosphodiesterase class II)
MIRRPWHFRLHIYIAALFLALIVAFSIASLTMEYFKSREVILAQANAKFRDIEAGVSNSIEDRYGYAVFGVDVLSDSMVTGATTLAERLNFLEMFTQILRDQPKLASISIGYDTGDYFSVYRLVPDLPLVKLLKPPANATFLVQSVERSGSEPTVTQYLFIDDALKKIGEKTVRENPIDPRTRPWFKEAMNNKRAIVTTPYAFFTTNEIGTTIAKHGQHGRSVIRINVTLANLSRFLRDVRPTPSAKVAIVDEQGQVLAASDFSNEELADPVTAADSRRFAERHGTVVGNAVAAVEHETSMKVFSLKDQQGVWYGSASRLDIPQVALYLAIVAPEGEVLADVIHMRNRNLAMAFGQMLVLIVLTLGCSRLASRPLNELTREAAEIRALKFNAPTQIRSIITEIDALARTMATMKSTIHRFLEMGAALAGERNFQRLLELLLVEAMEIATARGVAVYLSEPNGSLKCPLARWDGSGEFHPADLHPERDTDHPVSKALADGALVYQPSAAELSHWYPDLVGGSAPLLIAVALRNRPGVVIGAMLLVQDRDTHRGVQEREVLAVVEGLAGTAAIAIERQLLLLEQKRLFEGLIELVANAIDRKSPYTGGHCRRVPELVQMIARAAAAATSGPFKEFAPSEEQWETLHIAGWLHDCGKVTTPEYVVDKATKLETIYDRLHEVRMRFEVLKREAEVACWQAIAAGEPSATQLSALREQWDVLDEEFAFVAECNEGAEFMAPEKVERLRRIAKRTWTRTLDDCIGLSTDEQGRRAVSSAALPATEPLLADKPEHIFVRQPRDSLAPDNPWGFKIPVPEHLYNRGEIHNLAIDHGTLSEEDRYKIDEHIVETIRMLSHLPWPRHLDQVVEYAGGHHERMDGKGYPRGLHGNEMSVPARMMAVADIFEALTAADRPYKSAKTLSEALGIMARMRDAGHIDPDIFELFVSAEVYQDYAEQFLRREQMDVVDVTRYTAARANTPGLV